jgi:hypothetical protein
MPAYNLLTQPRQHKELQRPDRLPAAKAAGMAKGRLMLTPLMLLLTVAITATVAGRSLLHMHEWQCRGNVEGDVPGFRMSARFAIATPSYWKQQQLDNNPA